MSKEFKEKVREHFKDVDEKDFEQKVRAFNGLDNQKYNPISVSIGTALFEHYKADYLKQINRPFSNKKAIIISFKNKVEKLLKKYTEIHSQIILGKSPIFFTDDIFEMYWYFTQKHWAIEIMKFQDYLSEQEKFNDPPQPPDEVYKTYKAKHYVLAYLFDCNVKGEIYPIGNKKDLERIGNKRMGAGKGNRFYKVFNTIINKDLNAEKDLFEIDENWKEIVLSLSENPEQLKLYLSKKHL